MSRVRIGIVGLFSLAALLATTQPAQAEEIKPYVMLLFDTSGSMTWSICANKSTNNGNWLVTNGDNTAECPGNDVSCSQCDTSGCDDGQKNDTRLFKVKAGASSVVSAFGEVTWGLSRFHQAPQNFTCNYSGGHYGGWYGTNCSHTMGTYGNQADILVPFRPANQTSILRWMNNCDDYPTAGHCPDGVVPGTGHPKEPATPRDDANCTLCPDCAHGCDLELRGGGGTPIAGSLYDLRTTFFPAVLGADTKAACRPYKVILLTDGQDTCPGNPNTEAQHLFEGLGLPDTKQVKVHVIGFGDASLKPALDGIAAAGGTTEAIIVDNEISLALAMASIISESILHETCNGADDDCDGECDETWPEVGVSGAGCSNTHTAQTCTAGLGICQRTGHYTCKSDGSGTECNVTPGPPNAGGEICGNGLDDDCDGQIDEGCVPCISQPEICNGKDDDCDTVIDEDYTSVPCGSDIGECKKGTTSCVAGAVVCNGSAPPTSELCNNKDDNCDTVVDGFTQACYPYSSGCSIATGTCVGVCQVGSELCTNGSFGACAGAVGPTAEICNHKDDNCNGTVDEGVTNHCTKFSDCSSYDSCAACPLTPTEVCNLKDDDCNGTIDDITGKPCGTDTGECSRGVTACDAQGKEVCTGGVGPTAETCDGKDNDCNGKIDDNVGGQVGQACGTLDGECTQGVYQCVAGSIQCVGGIGPQPEVCDGKDNDCDKAIDEDIPATACGSDEGECTAGKTVCQNGALTCQGAIGPSPEFCDGKDNDCNGIKDDNPTDVGNACGLALGECVPGQNQCVNGKIVCAGSVGPKTEVCDGLDNDCNGTVDDNVVGAGATCGTTDEGECQMGKMDCQKTPNGWNLVCTGSIGPQPEICDAKDNDCDKDVDESYPESGTICGTNVGECQAGTWACNGGKLVCEGGTGGTPEVCDGKDNDCNYAIDDNVPGEGAACGTDKNGKVIPNYVPVGECKAGQTKCIGGTFQCIGGTQPSQEICDGKDNDCDGVADNNAVCPGSSSCVEGQCVLPCGTGEFKCPGGTVCTNGFCIPNACAKVDCKDTERCVDGKCIERCAGVTCTTHEVCNPKTGLCADNTCLSKGCPQGETCVNYACVKDPCADKNCGADEMCVDGQCIEPCVNVTCPSGEVCVQGKCKDDPCATYPCPENQACVLVDGKPQCQADPCAVMSCAPGQVCRQGQCQDDPCKTTTCPTYLKCEVTHDGQANCVPKEGAKLPTTTKMLAAGGGGFGCALAHDDSSTGSGAGGLLGLALLGLAAIFRRRRS
ncbi:MAG: hypothetical protein KAI47_05855 [Deltaproteobacteria bacterium]|nr:hypothetical protein [Deltaproteobacteria bacterium]